MTSKDALLSIDYQTFLPGLRPDNFYYWSLELLVIDHVDLALAVDLFAFGLRNTDAVHVLQFIVWVLW